MDLHHSDEGNRRPDEHRPGREPQGTWEKAGHGEGPRRRRSRHYTARRKKRQRVGAREPHEASRERPGSPESEPSWAVFF